MSNLANPVISQSADLSLPLHIPAESTRFGMLSIPRDRVIEFKAGLYGFEKLTQWAILQPLENPDFSWFHSMQDPSVAFVICEADNFRPEFSSKIPETQRERLADKSGKDLSVFIICNRHGESLTGNFQGPLVINRSTRQGEQLILEGHPIRENLIVRAGRIYTPY